jgi:hypothetical protein
MRDPDAALTPEQRVFQKRIREAQDKYRFARETAEERARQQIRDELAGLEYDRNEKVREAHALYKRTKDGKNVKGLSIAAIQRAMRTKDYRTVADIVADLNVDKYFQDETPSFVFDRENMTVHINWWEWEGVRYEEPMILLMVPDRDEYGQPTGMLVPDHNAKEWPDHPLTKLFLAGDWAPFDAFESEIRDAWGK